MLDIETCTQAFLRRDRAFDGLFFVAVKTTGIYCRPVCPARTPLVRNTCLYPSAAAAERAGYRPCLRCRPETAPFCPAWNGTKSTVSRALRLIEAGALDGAGLDGLAARLGISGRHLCRLFGQHLGASPLEVARTRRMQKAKRLLDETDLAVCQVALRAGFRSVRRMNAAFAQLYGRPPSAFRRPRTLRQRASAFQPMHTQGESSADTPY